MTKLSPVAKFTLCAVALFIVGCIISVCFLKSCSGTQATSKLVQGRPDTGLTVANTTVFSQGKPDTALTVKVTPPVTRQLTGAQIAIRRGAVVAPANPRTVCRPSTTASPGGPNPAPRVASNSGRENRAPAVDTSDNSDPDTGRGTGEVTSPLQVPADTLSFCDTFPDGSVVDVAVTGPGLPDDPAKLSASITFTRGADTSKTVSRTDTLTRSIDSTRSIKETDTLKTTIVKKPLISAPVAFIGGLVLGALAIIEVSHK